MIVSLYGLRTAQEIDDAMVAALYPWTKSDSVKIAASVGKAVLKHAKIELPQLKSSDLINRMSAEVFIFDDLERCGMPVTDAFGYINQLVEQDGCKVIVLANEEELLGNTEYSRGKEKLIGKTLVVEPDFEAAFVSFIADIDDIDTRDIYIRLNSEIRTIYEQSLLQNLRILQQTLWDFERVYSVLHSRHRANQQAMAHVLRLFFVLSIEHKAGTLTPDDLENRTNRALSDAMGKDDKPSTYRKVGAKYPGVRLYDSLLSDQVVYDLLVRGEIKAEALKRSLDESSWFASADESAWRTLWYAAERDDDLVQAAAHKMLEEFAERYYSVSGEILHVCGQLLWLSDIGVSGWDRPQTVAECKAYIDDIRGRGKLEPPGDAFFDGLRHGVFGGLGFSQNTTPEFKDLWKYLKEQRSEAAVDRYADQAKALAAMMSTDPASFVRQIVHHGDGPAPFANVPVFRAIDCEEFAEQLIALEPLAFREALLGFSARYDMGRLGRDLSGERPWAEELQLALLKRAQDLHPVARDRITKNVQWTLGKELEELREAEAKQR